MRPIALALLFASLALAQPRREPDVPYVPTTPEAVQAMLKLAQVGKDDVVYDLGSGDGRIVIAAARDFGARGVGIDINPERIAEARENARKAQVEDRVRFLEGDLFEADIHEATVVTLFLLSTVNDRLLPKLRRDLKPGTRIVSNTFSIRGWKPDKKVEVDNSEEGNYLSHTLYLWTVPAAKP